MSIAPDEGANLHTLFDPANYLYFNEHYLTEARTQTEIAFIREHVGVRPNFAVLDLACGHGRHANRIAPEVHSIIGLDTNADFLAIAREDAFARGISNVTYTNQDIRDLSHISAFDRVMLLNTVFGLFSDRDHEHLLGRINRALKLGGRVCFDVVNRDTILIGLQADTIVEKEGNYMLDRLRFDERTGRMSNRRIYIRDGVTVHAPFSLRLYNYSEIATLLAAAGLQVVSVHANWKGDPMDYQSKAMVFVAEKIGEVRGAD